MLLTLPKILYHVILYFHYKVDNCMRVNAKRRKYNSKVDNGR